MNRTSAHSSAAAVTVRVPGDKSITHRALLLAALATGRSVIRRPLAAADTESTASVLRTLGCAIPVLSDHCEIDGVGLRGLSAPRQVLDCGNSGTTARLLMGTLAGHSFAATLSGDDSLRRRPMRRVMDPLSLMGATFEELRAPDRLPIRVHGGALRPLQYDSPRASAQVKSAILLAALTGSADAAITEPYASRDHTERMLEQCGVPLHREVRGDGRAVTMVRPVSLLEPLDIEVPGDASSAAFIAAFACLSPAGSRPVSIADVGLNPTRIAWIDVLRRMGAGIDIACARSSCGEPLGSMTVHGAPLRAVHVSAAEIPLLIDELPMIAVLAARADGTTVIDGAGELRVKESDRIRALVTNLQTIGVHAEELADGLVVHGSARPLAGMVRTFGDHRIALAFGVLGAASAPGVSVDDTGVVGVSFPNFWELLGELIARVRT
jgi:3-phosphoshikimate 1-carboxyvinyltransferase